MLARRYADGAEKLPPRKRLLYIVIVVAVGLAGMFAAAGIGGVVGILMAEEQGRAQLEAGRQIDQERPPFTASIAYDTTTPAFWKYVLDRALTAEERETLEAIPFGEGADYGDRLLRPVARRSARRGTGGRTVLRMEAQGRVRRLGGNGRRSDPAGR